MHEETCNSTPESPEPLPQARTGESCLHTKASDHCFLGSQIRPTILTISYVILILLAFISGSVLQPGIALGLQRGSCPHAQHTTTKLRTFVPSLSLERTVFQFNPTFAGDPSENVTNAWLSLIPKGQGVVRLPVRHDFGSEIYNIAAFHSLHCLYTLRESFFAFHRMAAATPEFDSVNSAKMLEHGRHCFEYVRQVLICNPDLNLEPIEGGTGSLKTWGYQRQCVAFQQLGKWAEDMRASDNEGIV